MNLAAFTVVLAAVVTGIGWVVMATVRAVRRHLAGAR